MEIHHTSFRAIHARFSSSEWSLSTELIGDDERTPVAMLRRAE
jgi:hypothetical protein